MKRPNQEEFSTKPPTYYGEGDFYVGARLEFNKHKFIIIDADDYAYNYMEQNCRQVRRAEGVRVNWLRPNVVQRRVNNIQAMLNSI